MVRFAQDRPLLRFRGLLVLQEGWADVVVEVLRRRRIVLADGGPRDIVEFHDPVDIALEGLALGEGRWRQSNPANGSRQDSGEPDSERNFHMPASRAAGIIELNKSRHSLYLKTMSGWSSPSS